MATVHLMLIWALAAGVPANNKWMVFASAAALTALVAIASRRNWRLIRETEAAQRSAAERQALAVVIDAAPALAAVVDDRGKLIYSNLRFREVLRGADGPSESLADAPLVGADKLLDFAASGGAGPIEADLEFQRSHNKVLLHFSASRQTLPGLGECVVLIGQDDTLRHRAQQSMVQTAKLAALGELSSGITHELRQPLNVIRMAAQNVLLEAAPPVSVEEDEPRIEPMSDADFRPFALAKLERVVDQVDRADSIVSRMHIFSRSSHLGVSQFDVPDACEAALTLMAAPLRRAGVGVVRDWGDEPVAIVGHEALLQQVLVNLLINARDALVGGGVQQPRVTLAVRRGLPGRISLQVRDNGPGVPEEIRSRIFEPFFTTKPTGSNSGLGLSLARSIVHDAGGELRLLADEPGAAFEIELPVQFVASDNRL
jgi:C4-dicarboxylate-specific signal transduction histidine kinase